MDVITCFDVHKNCHAPPDDESGWVFALEVCSNRKTPFWLRPLWRQNVNFEISRWNFWKNDVGTSFDVRTHCNPTCDEQSGSIFALDVCWNRKTPFWLTETHMKEGKTVTLSETITRSPPLEDRVIEKRPFFVAWVWDETFNGQETWSCWRNLDWMR